MRQSRYEAISLVFVIDERQHCLDDFTWCIFVRLRNEHGLNVGTGDFILKRIRYKDAGPFLPLARRKLRNERRIFTLKKPKGTITRVCRSPNHFLTEPLVWLRISVYN